MPSHRGHTAKLLLMKVKQKIAQEDQVEHLRQMVYWLWFYSVDLVSKLLAEYFMRDLDSCRYVENFLNFGEIHKLLPICDEIIKLKAFCSLCKNGTLGIFSKRISDNKSKILVGSDKDYIAVCRKCY